MSASGLSRDSDAMSRQSSVHLQAIFKQSYGGHPIFPGSNTMRPEGQAAGWGGRIKPHSCPGHNPRVPVRCRGAWSGAAAQQMGAGTDVAIESAGLPLVKGDLRGIIRA
jgi:hypothetical protein